MKPLRRFRVLGCCEADSIIFETGARRTSSALAGDPSLEEGFGVPNRRRRREDILGGSIGYGGIGGEEKMMLSAIWDASPFSHEVEFVLKL